MLLVLTLDIRLRLVLEITLRLRHIQLLLKIKKHTDNRLVLTTHIPIVIDI